MNAKISATAKLNQKLLVYSIVLTAIALLVFFKLLSLSPNEIVLLVEALDGEDSPRHETTNPYAKYSASNAIAEALRDEMLSTGAKRAWWGVPELMQTAYMRAGGRVAHPLNRVKIVIEAARKSELFVANGYIRAQDSLGRREVLHPVFVLRPVNVGGG